MIKKKVIFLPYRTETKEDITDTVTVHRGALSPDKIQALGSGCGNKVSPQLRD